MQFARTYVAYAATALEVVGVTVITVGVLLALAIAAVSRWRRTHQHVYDYCRSILLGLELLVAADIVNTVAIEPTLRSVGVLTIIIVLSLTREVETTGRWPWLPASEP